jgi:phosphoglycolate phosphatase
MTVLSAPIEAVLFDLDGTLADTAGDLAAAANSMLKKRGLATKPLHLLRPQASHGARGLLGVAFGVAPQDAGYEALRVEFLDTYEKDLCVTSRLFDGMPELLDYLEARHISWGVVTNKVSRFTIPLMMLLRLNERAACIVSGDTTPHAKPHPAPLLEAARLIEVAPERCVYIGDDARDIAAGSAAGMQTVAAAYGYCGDSDPNAWQADAVVQQPADLLALLQGVLHTQD